MRTALVASGTGPGITGPESHVTDLHDDERQPDKSTNLISNTTRRSVTTTDEVKVKDHNESQVDILPLLQWLYQEHPGMLATSGTRKLKSERVWVCEIVRF
jgi:hypothetical protein